MGIPTSEVGYTSAMPRREDHEVHKDMWGHWEKKKLFDAHSINYYSGNMFRPMLVTLHNGMLNTKSASVD